jgi:hypothetical protein
LYERILKEVKKRDNDRFVRESKDKNKAMWQLINKEIGKSLDKDYRMELRIGDEITSCPTVITEKLNEHFINAVQELVKQNGHSNGYSSLEINHCVNTCYINPVTEDEIVKLSMYLKSKTTPGYDDIPESLVKRCIQLIKNHWDVSTMLHLTQVYFLMHGRQ